MNININIFFLIGYSFADIRSNVKILHLYFQRKEPKCLRCKCILGTFIVSITPHPQQPYELGLMQLFFSDEKLELRYSNQLAQTYISKSWHWNSVE